jgi:hypothetical protein
VLVIIKEANATRLLTLLQLATQILDLGVSNSIIDWNEEFVLGSFIVDANMTSESKDTERV